MFSLSKNQIETRGFRPKKIWIDLDNSPHVLFFNPIIRELKKRGYIVVVTVRDHAQVCDLADMLNLKYTQIGRHYGKNGVMKVLGVFVRSLQMLPYVLYHKPDMAFSHGSRCQFFLSEILKLPYATAFDYEHATSLPFVRPTMGLMPEVIPEHAVKKKIKHIVRYPGIKEDVYVSEFKPDGKIRKQLGVGETEILATVRPPAMDAHYQSPESDVLFKGVMDHLMDQKNLRVVVLPRGDNQAASIRGRWHDWISNGKLVIPLHVVDGLNLIWHSDLVLSGGGTVIREAAALNVPAYSFFRGKTGEVDRYLSETGRLTMIQHIDDVKDKILIQKRHVFPKQNKSRTLQYIVQHIVEMIEGTSVTR